MFNIFIENFLSDELCDSLIQLGLHTELQVMTSAKIVNGKVIGDSKVNLYDNKRRGSYFDGDILNDKLFLELTDKLINTINQLKPFNGIEYTDISKYTFNEYGSGDFLNWHKDSHEVIYGATSTIIIQLNDNYSGGDVLYKIDNETFTIPKKKGSIFVFDSNIEHSVSKLESGIRYSMNAWPESKIKKMLL
jgi:predicted 2-oxoglutarate/Fe(II)-dependent dioxygenase YbiX